MSDNIVVLGGGSLASDMYDLYSAKYNFVGVIDDIYEVPYVTRAYGLKYLGKTNDIENIMKKGMQIILGIGSIEDMHPRQTYIKLLDEKKLTSPILSAINCHISKYSSIGDGTIIGFGSRIGPHVKVGRHCIIKDNVTIGHNTVLGDNVFIGSGVRLNGNVTIGSNTFIGTGAIVIQKRTIGNFCIVGASSCIIRNVPEHSKVVGNPGKVIGWVNKLINDRS